MAQFCTKCGTPLPEGMQFCTGCGAPVGQPSAPAPQAAAPPPMAPVPQPPAAPAPYTAPAPATPAAAPAAKKGGSGGKIILIILAVIVFLTLLGAGGCVCVYYFYLKPKAIKIEKQAEATFPTSMGSREAQNQPMTPGGAPGVVPGAGPLTTPDIASLAYPGATSTGASGGQVFPGMGGVKVQEYLTSDSVDTVANYYKGKLGNDAMVTQANGGAVVQMVGSNGILTIAINPDQGSGKTKISISSIGKQ